MPLTEFELIARYFADIGIRRADVVMGVGDDCALMQVPPDRLLAVTTDTLVEGVHFLPGTDPEALGFKALAVNLSDLAAIGAEPAWASLAISLPGVDALWLEGFSRGFGTLARQHQVQLIGGDTTRGPRSITVQVQGFIEPGKELRRDSAQAGDLIYVTGTLGDAGMALRSLQAGRDSPLRHRLERPQPRLEVGRRVAGIASSAIDISDGLLADLGHICTESGVGAGLQLARLPLSPPVASLVADRDAWEIPLASGDDYELCITVAPANQADLESAVATLDVQLTRIGVIEGQAGIRCHKPDGTPLGPVPGGYRHFEPD